MQFVDGGVTAPLGFTANGILNHIKAGRNTPDTALLYSERRCVAAGVFTQNRVKAECVKLTERHIADGRAQAVIANSGNANACTGTQGYAAAVKTAECVAATLGVRTEDVLVCSTGVIGQQLPVTRITSSLQSLADGLSKQGHVAAREAIMTTDTRYKECAVTTTVGGKTVTLGTMAKGSGMIHINLGTMLGFITTDCAISATMLQTALAESAAATYNCVSIDGDTSTNDTLLILANGMAENAEITGPGADYDAFLAALNALNTEMARSIAADGEGATRLITCTVTGATTVQTARGLAKAVISSNLVKAAFFGRDANWGRILDAMGYSGYEFTPEQTSVSFMSSAGAQRYAARGEQEHGTMRTVHVFANGVPLDFDEALAEAILSEEAVEILVELHDGSACGTAWGCDLTYDYVKINGDYRT